MGFRENSRIAGVILNEASEALHSYLKSVLEEETGLKVFGYMPRLEGCALESRHLGLVTASEVTGLDAKVERLAAQAERSLDLDGLLRLASSAPPLPEGPPGLGAPGHSLPSPFRLAVARDEAFCFYYRDALDLLEELGGELVFFSPLRDSVLPGGAHGLYLGGGYPELYAARLSSNVSMLEDIARKVRGGLPTLAECGGFMTLCGSMRTGDGTYAMSGVLEGETFMTQRLTRFGYVEMRARRESLLAGEGDVIRGHEFHYSDGTDNGDGFAISKPGPRAAQGVAASGVHAWKTLYAGYPHVHLCGAPGAAERFARACSEYGRCKE
jgi:cobyrinic acid a,c-diamide synthase